MNERKKCNIGGGNTLAHIYRRAAELFETKITKFPKKTPQRQIFRAKFENKLNSTETPVTEKVFAEERMNQSQCCTRLGVLPQLLQLPNCTSKITVCEYRQIY